MPRNIERLLTVLLAVLTVLALYAAAKFVVPQVLNWFKYLLIILIPFLIALVISLLLEPLIKGLQDRTGLSRTWSTLFSMLAVFGGLGAVITLLVIRLVAELTELSTALPGYIKSLQGFLDGVIKKGQVFYLNLPEQVTSQLEQAFNLENVLNSLGDTLQSWASSIANNLLGLMSAVPGAIIIILISLVATYFICRDRDRMAGLWIKFVPAPWGERTLNINRQVSRAFLNYIKAQLILVMISIIVSILGLSVIGTEYAITLGLIIGFFDLIPVLGPGTVYIPWAAGAFIAGSHGLGIKLLVLYLIVMVVRGLLEAKVVATNLGLHPLAVLVAMYAGLKIIGVLGLILGPIIVITIQAAVNAYTNVYKLE